MKKTTTALLSILLAAFASGCASSRLPKAAAEPARPDPVATAMAAMERYRLQADRDAVTACVAKALAGGKDLADGAVQTALAACAQASAHATEAAETRAISLQALLECYETLKKQGKSEEDARKECASKKLPGIRLGEDADEATQPLGTSAAAPSLPVVPGRRMLIGRVGAAVPTGWDPTSGFHVTRGPAQWSDEARGHVPFCDLEITVDGMPVFWTDGANAPTTVPVPPGTGMAPFGGLRTAALPAGEQGYIRFDRVIEPDGRVSPHYPSSSLHTVKARCWKYSVLPESAGGASRLAEHAVLALEMPAGEARTGPGIGDLAFPARVFRPAPPLPTRPLL